MTDPQHPNVSFTVNVCNSDAPYLDNTLRHMNRALNFPFSERLVAYDPGRQDGKYTTRASGSREQIEKILAGLLDDRIIDRIDIVPWTEASQRGILLKYFGNGSIDLKDFSGAPIYQYLFAFDACRGDYLLHVDSDMLFYRSSNACWIDEGLETLRRESRVVVVTPQGGPPQAKNWLERLTGRSFERQPTTRWSFAPFTSTRYFLADVAKLHACLPLQQSKPGEPLENSLSHTFGLKGYQRWSMTGYDQWAIHPWKHDENFVEHLDDLIWAVENGIYPFRRTGYQWDMRTEGEHIQEWTSIIQRNRETRSKP